MGAFRGAGPYPRGGGALIPGGGGRPARGPAPYGGLVCGDGPCTSRLAWSSQNGRPLISK